MKIAFWSPLHGTGATSNLLALALTLAMNKDRKILVTQTHFSMNNLEKPLVGRVDSEQFFEDTGLDAVMRHFKSGNLTREQVAACSIKICENLFLLAGTKVSSRESYENVVVQSMVTHIITQIEKYYDYIFVDTNSGNNPQTAEIIKECDAVAVTLRQNRNMINLLSGNEMLEGKRIYYLFSCYDEMSRYNLNNIRRLYKQINKRNSGGILYDTGYMDALCEDSILRYISSASDCEKTDYDTPFYKSLRETADGFLKFISEVK